MFPIPNLEEQVDRLEVSRVFSSLDLKNGYFHVPINKKSQKYTSFVTPNGQYEFNRVPFGLSTSLLPIHQYYLPGINSERHNADLYG